jgi:hypothetical protein
VFQLGSTNVVKTRKILVAGWRLSLTCHTDMCIPATCSLIHRHRRRWCFFRSCNVVAQRLFQRASRGRWILAAATNFDECRKP